MVAPIHVTAPANTPLATTPPPRHRGGRPASEARGVRPHDEVLEMALGLLGARGADLPYGNEGDEVATIRKATPR